MRGAGGAGAAGVGAIGAAEATGTCALGEVCTGGAGTGGATTAAGGAEIRGGGAAGGAGVATTGLSGTTALGLAGATTEAGGAGGAIEAGGEGGTGLGIGGTTTGFETIGGAGGLGGGATSAFFWVMAFRTSPGREMWDRSILVLISSSPRSERADFAACAGASDEPRRCTRTFSASCSSRELECVFFSVTPTIGRTSRMALLFTSSSLARSLIRTLLIRPFFSPRCA
jgi:hypothetical protein